jgi:hypothetical protein
MTTDFPGLAEEATYSGHLITSGGKGASKIMEFASPCPFPLLLKV